MTQTNLDYMMLLIFHNNYKPPLFQMVLHCSLHKQQNEVRLRKWKGNDCSADKGAHVDVVFHLSQLFMNVVFATFLRKRFLWFFQNQTV